MTRTRLCRALLVALLVAVAPRPSSGHELRPAALAVDEVAQGRFRVRLSRASNVGSDWTPEVRFPSGCRVDGVLLDCHPDGLNGEISVSGFASASSRVITRVTWLDGRDLVAVLTRDAPNLGVRSVRAEGAQRLRTMLDYTRLGIEHILSGIDHVLFVLGLILLVRFGRGLIGTITAFTLAHSLTLSAAVLGLVSVPVAPVEAVIALSILLLAVECAKPSPSGGASPSFEDSPPSRIAQRVEARRSPTGEDQRASLARRLPWVVAFSFGLLHGLGFAGALKEAGLPPSETPLALLCFNVGVELGQLVMIGALGLVVLFLGRWLALRTRVEKAVVYAMGALAAFWSIERVIGVFGG